MNTPNLSGKKIAIITENGFEEIEITSPKKALEEAGATVHIISRQDKVKAWDTDHWSIELSVDVNIAAANSDDYDGLLIPGGVINPDKMRTEKAYIAFAAEFLENRKTRCCYLPRATVVN